MELESFLCSLPGDGSLLLYPFTREAAEVQDSFLVWDIAVHSWGADKPIFQGGWSFLLGRCSPGRKMWGASEGNKCTDR